MNFKLRKNALYSDDNELILDLHRVSDALGKTNITRKEYDLSGGYNSATYIRRFGGWNNALKKAGLAIGLERTITEEALFENLANVWKMLNRQPYMSEIRQPLSKYNHATYQRRFGSWLEACKAFIKYKNENIDYVKSKKTRSKFNSRTISEKIRLKILKRDNYACVICGRSPANERGVILHIDHVKPFSKGGDNSIENLQTRCSKCNLGKNNDETV